MGITTNLSRRGFLRGNRRGRDVIRPPGSPSEELFTDQCRRCGECITACETGVLVSGDGGFPEINFNHSGCTFCGDCISSCKHQVLQAGRELWPHRPDINDHCLAFNKVNCRTCQESCEVEAISFRLKPGGVAFPEINSGQCTGCGECVSGCPVTAINMHRPVKTNK